MSDDRKKRIGIVDNLLTELVKFIDISKERDKINEEQRSLSSKFCINKYLFNIENEFNKNAYILNKLDEQQTKQIERIEFFLNEYVNKSD